MKQKNVIAVRKISLGKLRLAICKRCNEPDTNHEIEYPSKRTIIKNDKKVVVCEAFQSNLPIIEEPKVELLNAIVLPK